MPTSTRRFSLGFLSGAALLALAACDPCAQEPALCMPGAPGGWATGGEDAGDGDAAGSEEDDGGTGGEGANAPGDEEGGTAAAAAGESDGGQRGGEGGADGDPGGSDDAGGSGESGGSDDAGGSGDAEDSGESGDGGASTDDSGDALLCWARFDACLEAAYPEQACLVDLRVCMVGTGVDMPDGECLGSITKCLRDGGDVVACLDEGSACVGAEP